ncbi:MAG: S-methyl-5-thioribose-1-phosphate isomerase [Fuerstiella sp.]|nr:S-methyl-5-thioribose-1-phosphate isomerase [Fuerstiella sp.]
MHRAYHTLRWEGDALGTLYLIDQTLLPEQFTEINAATVEDVWHAIRQLSVRGAPAIGVAAAWGAVLGTQQCRDSSRAEFDSRQREVSDYLAGSRPTAVNLSWALQRLQRIAESDADATAAQMHQRLFEEAALIQLEDEQMCDRIGRHGAELLESGTGVLTHCNAGSLATAGNGTALSVIFSAKAAGKQLHVYADETRPLLQGARLTAWELQQRDVEVTVICDNMAAQVMKEGRIQAVVTGADRIAANGDVANKIGTYGVALLARAHGIPFYVAAPSSTFDLVLATGNEIPIEQRADTEVTHGFGRQTVPAGVDVYNPAFDVTPAPLIDAIITERGVVHRPETQSVCRHLG